MTTQAEAGEPMNSALQNCPTCGCYGHLKYHTCPPIWRVSPDTCHRTVVADALAAMTGWSVVHADAPVALAERQLPALTVRQPWAWLIVHGGKDVENRTWRRAYTGPLAIHAAATMTNGEYMEAFAFAARRGVKLPRAEDLPMGAIVGRARVVDWVTESDSPWFTGPYGLVLREPVACTPIPMRGSLGLWPWTPPEGWTA